MYGRKPFAKLALNLGVDPKTVYTWKNKPDDWHIPPIAEVAIKGLYAKYEADEKKKAVEIERLRKAGLLRPKLRRKRVVRTPP